MFLLVSSVSGKSAPRIDEKLYCYVLSGSFSVEWLSRRDRRHGQAQHSGAACAGSARPLRARLGSSARPEPAEALTSSLGALGRAGGVLVPAFGEELSFCMQLSFPRTLFRFAFGAICIGREQKLAGQGQFPSLVGP